MFYNNYTLNRKAIEKPFSRQQLQSLKHDQVYSYKQELFTRNFNCSQTYNDACKLCTELLPFSFRIMFLFDAFQSNIVSYYASLNTSLNFE